MAERNHALITGAAKRIGKDIALSLAREGFDITLHYHASEAEAHETISELKSIGVLAGTITGDLRKAETAQSLIEQVTKQSGPLTCLINNASIFEPDDIVSLTLESWDDHINLNLRTPVLLTRAFAAQLARGTSGNVINLIDQRVRKPTPEFFSYQISKSALWTATRVMAQALAPDIRVNAIAPGPTLANSRMDDATFTRQRELTLLGRGSSPSEISAAVKFILSSASMTGQMITLDGGQHLLWQTPDVLEIRE